MNPQIFKAYDIRGVYPSEIDEDTAYAIGRATVTVLGAKTLAVGRDARLSGPSLQEALIRGITDAGCDVISIGMVTTPMLYFSSWHLDVDGALSVTASHNPAEYNGIKICRKNAVPVGENSGLFTIRDLVISASGSDTIASGSGTVSAPDPFPERGRVQQAVSDLGSVSAPAKGIVTPQDVLTPYYDFFATFAKFGDTQFHIAIDCANTMGVLELPFYEKYFAKNFEIEKLYCNLDHPYTAHEANPLKTETLNELRALVVEKKCQLGIAYDGDADRVGFVDEKGEIIPMDLVTGLIAQVLLEENPGRTVLYDLRSSNSVKEVIEECGGVAKECRVGHAFIKQQMAEEHALFAGELSGHYYFEANKNGEVSTLAAFTLLNLMAKTGRPISELVAHLRRYFHSGEINSEVKDKDAVLARLAETYQDGSKHTLDGLKVSYPDWWFNVRPSNTEPVLRLNLEAKTKETMEQKRDELLALIRS